jgi:polyhydroxyalkanoate synthesis regulator phasin
MKFEYINQQQENNVMKELLKKTVLTGIGFAAISKDKIEEIIGEMIEKGSLTEQEGKKFVEEIVGYADKTRAELEKQVDNYVEKALKRMDVVRKSDLIEMQTAIHEIQKRLEEREKKEF